MLKGIDVSYWQGNIDWAKVKAEGVDFAIIRAGYGGTVDPNFAKYAAGARSVGIAVGVYWFSYALNKSEAIAEANFCYKAIKGHGVTLPVYYDFEYDTERYAAEKGVTYTKSTRTAIIQAFCDRINALGLETGVYINPDYIMYKTNWAKLKKYPLWLAMWVNQGGWIDSFEAADPGAVNKSWGVPEIWQFGKTKLNGVAADVDVNYGYFDLDKPAKPVAPEAPVVDKTIKQGDTVRVINTTKVLGKKRGKQYSGGTFVVWYDKYTVLSINGKRAVIGIGKTVTAAVHVDNLEKVN